MIHWYCRGNTRDVVRRRRRVDLERVRASCFPRSYAFCEGLAPGEAAHGGTIIVAHRLFCGDCGEDPEQERRRYQTRGPHNTYGAGGGGWFEERFALRRTNCSSERDAAAEGRAARLVPVVS